jgi:hypothetical protein
VILLGCKLPQFGSACIWWLRLAELTASGSTYQLTLFAEAALHVKLTFESIMGVLRWSHCTDS